MKEMKSVRIIAYLLATYWGLFLKMGHGEESTIHHFTPIPHAGVISDEKETDSFFDKQLDYSLFYGRVTDRSEDSQVFKIQTETTNVKLLRAGDKLSFKVANDQEGTPCDGYVRGHEKTHLVVYVKNIKECWKGEGPMRRGTQLNFKASILFKRVLYAAQYRKVLIKSRKGFLKQLNAINNFIYSFDQKKVQLIADFDQRILEIQKEKQMIVDDLMGKKEEKIHLQKELIQKLDEIDEALDFYRIDKQENLIDRWNLDHDLGLPVGKRPQTLSLPP